jgi:hypothetical protein
MNLVRTSQKTLLPSTTCKSRTVLFRKRLSLFQKPCKKKLIHCVSKLGVSLLLNHVVYVVTSVL